MRSDTKAALVGIAGAFIGFRINVILGPLPSPLMHFILAGRRCHGGEGKPRAPSTPPPRYATCRSGSISSVRAVALSQKRCQHQGAGPGT